MKRAKSWEQVKKDWPDKPCVKANVFVPVDDSTDGLEVSVEGELPRGVAMLLVATALSHSPISPETDSILLDMAKRMILGDA